MNQFKAKPLDYLSHIIGHEGKGSLILFLRKKVWALSLMAGCDKDGFEMNETHSQFTINITLTQQGTVGPNYQKNSTIKIFWVL